MDSKSCIDVGSLVIHKSLPGYPSWGIGIVMKSWADQKIYDGVPPHDSDELIVLFNVGERIAKMHDLQML